MPSTKKVVRPCWATMKISVTTTSATSATQKPVIDRPMFSSLRLGMRFAMEEPFSSGQGSGGAPVWDAPPQGR